MKKLCILIILLISFFHLTVSAQPESDQPEKTGPDSVKIGAYVISLHDINFHDKEYTMRFWLWLLHTNPEFDFPYQVEIPNAKSLEKPDMMTDTMMGKIWCLMKMKASMKQSWNVGDFPFDQQRLNVKVENTVFDASSLVFVPDTMGSNFDPDLNVDGWEIKDFKVTTGTTNYNTAFGDPTYPSQKSSYSNFNINMVLERDAWGLFFKLFIGMYVAFMISSVSFMIDPKGPIEPRFGLPVGGLFAAVGNKYIIDSLLPETSEFTLVDTLHTTTFLCIFFTVAFSALSLIWVDRGQASKAVRLNKLGGSIIVGFYLLLNFVMIIAAIW